MIARFTIVSVPMDAYLEDDSKVVRGFAIGLTATLCLTAGLMFIANWNDPPSLPSWSKLQPQALLAVDELTEHETVTAAPPTASATPLSRAPLATLLGSSAEPSPTDDELNSPVIPLSPSKSVPSKISVDEVMQFAGIEWNSWIEVEMQAVSNTLEVRDESQPSEYTSPSTSAMPVTVLDIESKPLVPTILPPTEAERKLIGGESPPETPLLIADALDAIADVYVEANRFSGDPSGEFAGDLDPVESVPTTTKAVRAAIAPSVAKLKSSGASPNAEDSPLESESDRQIQEAADTPALATTSSRSSSEAVEDVKLDSEPPAAPENNLDADEEAAKAVRREPDVVITNQMAAIKPTLDSVLRYYYDRPLNTRDDSSWSVMHSLLGFGVNTPLAVNGPTGRRTNAVGWMAWNNPCANRRLLYLNNGFITGYEGPGFQGHPGQFLAMLAQINLKSDYPLRVEGKVLSVKDLVSAEMRTCAVDRELTFKLIGLSHYLQSNAEWTNEAGESWNLTRILGIELSQPVNGAACGGTHRIMAVSYAVRTKERRGETLEGPYVRAKKYMRDYHRYAMSLQNRNGSFSSDWFKRRTDWGDQNRQLQTTGHILEWLVYSLPRNELSDPRIVRAVDFLANLMIRNRYHDWEVGPRGHALRALSLYQQRVFQPQPEATPMARRATMTAGSIRK